MSNTFEYVSIFQQELDKAAVATATSGWMELNDKLIKYNGGADVKIPSITMDGLADYDRQEGYTDGAVNLKYPQSFGIRHEHYHTLTAIAI